MAKCTNCGAELVEGAKFCRQCGQKIEVAELTAEVIDSRKNDIEGTALTLRETVDKMISAYVVGMKDFEDSLAKIKEETAARIASLEEQIKEKTVLIESKDKEFAELNEKYVKLQNINQQIQTEKYDAQALVTELKGKLAAVAAAAAVVKPDAEAAVAAAVETVDAAAEAVETVVSDGEA